MVNMATAYSTGYLANGQLDKGGCHNHIPVFFLLSLSENLSTPCIKGPRLYYIAFHSAKEPVS